MKHTTSTDLRKNLSALMDKVNEDHEPLLVTRANGRPVLMISVEDYDSLDETAYLMSTKANRESLARSLEQVEAGRIVTPTMDEFDAPAGE
ncbi:type II toxin-antitoxin system Phd/YefM family antitoxin [Anianabacter salinae]|uniref:type II toxin-antitoxin system Phd/YefM family antitoxin n=1 Tax=Anianabacter salinae TaxID=2851023 RepID=UPI00225E065A|nr:type II toxin-antitoxin system prevent-host-death family antitoxin [Anianabacter salinae]MBV0912814.1 type II toxin-antitoxin system prevent-host-death family antitoxin [Anianabacter salinae]